VPAGELPPALRFFSRCSFKFSASFFFQFDLGSLLPETITGDGLCLLSRSDSSTSVAPAPFVLGASGWMGLKHCITKDLKTIATGMNDSYKMILYTLMHIRIFYASFQAEEQTKMCCCCQLKIL
jgi:hypothetical protein